MSNFFVDTEQEWRLFSLTVKRREWRLFSLTVERREWRLFSLTVERRRRGKKKTGARTPLSTNCTQLFILSTTKYFHIFPSAFHIFLPYFLLSLSLLLLLSYILFRRLLPFYFIHSFLVSTGDIPKAQVLKRSRVFLYKFSKLLFFGIILFFNFLKIKSAK